MRMDEMSAGRAALRKEFLQVAQRYTRFSRHPGEAKFTIGQASLNDGADTSEKLFPMKGHGQRIGRRKQCAKEIISCRLHKGVGRRGLRCIVFNGIPNQLVERAAIGLL